LEFFEKRYEQLLSDAQNASPEDAAAATSALTNFTGEYLDFAGAYGGNYKDVFDKVVGELQGVRDIQLDGVDAQVAELQGIKDLIGSTDDTLMTLEGMVAAYIAAESALDDIAWMNEEISLLTNIDTNMELLLAAQEKYYAAIENAESIGEKPSLVDEIKKHAEDLGDGRYDFYHPDIDILGEAAISQQPEMIADILGINKDDYSYAGGAILSGPSSGYQLPINPTFHGDEAVIPLKNGCIPVQIQGGGEAPKFNVVIKMGDREFRDFTVDVIKTDPEAQHQIGRVTRRVVNG
jgi:hypothetical protein